MTSKDLYLGFDSEPLACERFRAGLKRFDRDFDLGQAASNARRQRLRVPRLRNARRQKRPAP
jgi:hypothetical protein